MRSLACYTSPLQPEQTRAIKALEKFLSDWENKLYPEKPSNSTVLHIEGRVFSFPGHIAIRGIPGGPTWKWNQHNHSIEVYLLSHKCQVSFSKLFTRKSPNTPRNEKPPKHKLWKFNVHFANTGIDITVLWCERGEAFTQEKFPDACAGRNYFPDWFNNEIEPVTSIEELSFLKEFVTESVCEELWGADPHAS